MVSFSSRIHRVLFIFGISSFLLFSVLVAFLRIEEEKKRHVSHIASTVATAKEIIEDYVHQYDPAIRELISSLPPEGDKKKAHFLRESLSLHQGDLFYLLDGKGHVIDISTPFREYLGLDFSHLHPIRKRAPVSGVYQSLFHLRPVVSLLYPLPGRQLLVIEKDLQGIIPLVRHFNSTEWKTRGFLSIISHDGVVVYHPDETLIRSRHRLGAGLQTAPSGEQGLKSYISEGKRYLYYQQSLQEPLGWIMHYSFPYSVLSSTITREIVVQSLILALLFFLLIVSLTFVIGRNLSGPVHEIASHLSREDSAREGERVPEEMAHGIREISLIINATNTMMSILAAEKEKLSVTLRSIGDGVITTDTEGRVILINKAAEGLTGWMQEEAAGRDIGEVFPLINEKTRDKCENPVEKVLRTGKVVGLANHTALIARDGTERIIADSGAPIRDRESRVIGVVLVFRDITEKQKMEEELLKAAKLESLGILAGGIAHDFNNILTAILGNISLSKMLVNPEDKLHHRLSMAEKASLQAKDLVQQLLTFSKGGIPIRKSASVADIIRDSTGFILSGSNVKCVFHFPDDLWPVEVDAGQISQVINNLVLNAVHAMPEGGDYQDKDGERHPDSQGYPPPAQGQIHQDFTLRRRGRYPGRASQEDLRPLFHYEEEGKRARSRHHLFRHQKA